MLVGVTGAAGLIGTALCELLERRGDVVRRLDLALPASAEGRGDVAEPERARWLVAGCDAVVHLAAVSRVVWGELDPERCRRVNVGGTEQILAAAMAQPKRPGVVFASSREVYGEPALLPVGEDAECRPLNVYAHTKVTGETMMLRSRAAGLRTAVVRLSNVYGSVRDHADRVVPAFARAAAFGGQLRVDGSNHMFDFTHLGDVVSGLASVLDALAGGEHALPPIQLVTGHGTTLGELARLAIAAGDARATVKESPARAYDVTRFVGDPARAQALLGWRAQRSVAEGIRELVASFRASV